MSLRTRLTFLYTLLMGGITLIFGITVYILVSIILIDQIDQTLIRNFEEIRANTTVEVVGELNMIHLPSLDLQGNLFAQAWSTEGQLQSSNTGQFVNPLDERGLRSPSPVFRDIFIQNVHLRVLSVPLTIGDRPLGVLQLGASMAVVDATQNTLITVLLIGSFIAMAMAGLASWYSTRRALLPLQAVTQTALQITRADDLSRRILYQGSPNDEVGQLITAFNQTLGRLENLFNAQRRFLADVGHEFRTPLTVIKGNLALMRRFREVDDEMLDSIDSEADRLTRLVTDLLLLAQAESGKLPLARSTVELDSLLLEVMQKMRVLSREKLALRLGEIDQVLVCADPDRLKQVLVNLIGNAIKYTPQGGEVHVALSKQAEQALITVGDNGPGIPPEDLPHIFERFYRAEKSRTRTHDSKGFGLGLSIAYWIVRNHGGKIDVASTLGQGTTFSVWLPLHTSGECLAEGE